MSIGEELVGEPRAYFVRESASRLHPTRYVEGAWNPAEQHIAPALGVLAHAIEQDKAARGSGHLQLCRVSYDILGVLPLEAVEVEIEVSRPGKTIELVTARMSHAGRLAVIARAWSSAAYDTSHLAGTPFPRIPPPEETPDWGLGTYWPGRFVRSLELRRLQAEPGRATGWARTELALIEGETVGDTARFLGLIDVANGSTPRVAKELAAFPNLDLTVHLFRAPRGEWLGLDTSVTFGAGGLGLTHAVVHDQDGPFGALMQSLTVRPAQGS